MIVVFQQVTWNSILKDKNDQSKLKAFFEDKSGTIFLLIRAPSLIVAPPQEKPLNHDKPININFVD